MICILILNWNGWGDTIECLESICRLNYDIFRVIICDNDSSDGSLDKIKAWADGRLDALVSFVNPLRNLSYPPVDKTIPYRQYDRKEAEAGGSEDDRNCRLILIQTGANLGFAGGNNVGLRYALARGDFEYVWLLNNDTVVESNVLDALVKKADYYKTIGDKVGIMGSKLLYYEHPKIIQGIGGVYNKWFASTNFLGSLEQDNSQYYDNEVASVIDYPVGASLFVTKDFIQDVGLLCEEYFLYFEEIDWVLRGKKKCWQIGYCSQAKVFHKEGRSIGSSANGFERSDLSDFYGLRNRLLFTRKFYPRYLWSVKLGFLIVIFNRLRRCQFGRISLVLKASSNRSLKNTQYLRTF